MLIHLYAGRHPYSGLLSTHGSASHALGFEVLALDRLASSRSGLLSRRLVALGALARARRAQFTAFSRQAPVTDVGH